MSSFLSFILQFCHLLRGDCDISLIITVEYEVRKRSKCESVFVFLFVFRILLQILMAERYLKQLLLSKFVYGPVADTEISSAFF